MYVKVPVKLCEEKTGKKPIGVRWIDINKGDTNEPELRSSLVAKEITIGKKQSIFAATPPLEAKKALFSTAVTEGKGCGPGWQYKLLFILFLMVH